MLSMGQVKFSAYDFDPDGSCDLHGFCEFQIYEITEQVYPCAWCDLCMV